MIKKWLTCTHTKFVDQQACSVFAKAKSCIITRDLFIYNIIYNTKQKKQKNQQQKTTHKKRRQTPKLGPTQQRRHAYTD